MGWSCDVAPPVIQPGGKFLIVGDSITHGMTGDWTWRYRLWSWLKQNYDVTFLGPYRGTHGQTPRSAVYPTPPKFPGEATTTTPDIQGPYAGAVSSEFSLSGHGGYWGRQAAQVRYDIKGWVAAYQPQYLLILLGFNDLGWFVSGPEGLIGNMGALVQAAREGKPDVKILIGNVVDREFIEGRQDLVDNTARYNQLLKTTMPNWFRWESPLTYVDVNSNYNCRPGGCPDGYDGLHPNALGEWHIAEAFARSLRNDWGFAASTFSVPAAIDGRVVNPPGGLSCTANQEGNYVFWDADSQARGYEIRTRIQGMTDWWSSGAVYPSTTASFSSWVLEGQTWEYQVLTKGNAQDRSAWSGSVFCTAHPKTAPPPTEITSAPSGDGIQFNWKAVAGYNVNRYSIIVWDRDTEGAFFNMVAANCCGAFVGGLVAGHRYSIWMITHVNMVSSWTGAAEIVGGIPGGAREVIVGGGVPLAVTGLKVVNTEPTTIKLSWNIATGASAGYAIYYRSIRAGAETAQALAGTTTSTTYEIGFLWPGTWYYEFCVSAYNGNLESAKPCVVPPVYPGFRKRDFAGGNSTTILNGTAVANVTVSMADNMALRELFNSMYHNETALTMGVAPARNTTL
ncbi:SGNH hydrolase [Amniculicola lignicola CBS 123094]|uniref:SGNH hydrolase n=1 Tax=Amniculicola lignicola CBS 123094 TaxID=1392246 RepID=A0A6A5WRJ8_9PLEO|nr:SGNH hydrolase [Amniculicola lignicola CBS 123094]